MNNNKPNTISFSTGPIHEFFLHIDRPQPPLPDCQTYLFDVMKGEIRVHLFRALHHE